MKRVIFGAVVLVGTMQAQSADLKLRLVDPHVFRERELVRAELSGVTREWWVAGLLVEPARECGTMTQPCAGSAASPNSTMTINRYIQDLSPGTYRVRALTRRLTADGAMVDPSQYVTTD